MSGPLSLNARALHWVFKIGDREKAIHFFRDTLGMKVLRHEEFTEGCKATCNGPYNGRWSKTMIGYGAEDNHFVMELTYNYGVGRYNLGDDFLGISIGGKKRSVVDESGVLTSPDGYPFSLVDEASSSQGDDPVKSVTIGCKCLKRSLAYWKDLLGMERVDGDGNNDKEAVLQFGPNQVRLLLKELGKDVDHGTAFGRIAFAVPSEKLPEIERRVREAGSYEVLTPFTKLDTPGKATVAVVILADPDRHEICFVGEEAFKELSQVDDNANRILEDAMKTDKSKEWFAGKGMSKEEA